MKQNRRYRTWPALVVGFGLLVGLNVFSASWAYHEVARIHKAVYSVYRAYRQTARDLADIQSKAFQSAILLRDFLLAPAREASPDRLREGLEGLQRAIEQDLASLERSGNAETVRALPDLRAELGAYWRSVERVLDWSSWERVALSSSFLKKEVLPRRIAVLSLTSRIDRLAEDSLRRERRRIETSGDEYLRSLQRMQILSLLLACGVAFFSIVRTSHLERRSQTERERAEEAEEELRKLSQNLLHVHEEERKAISRELHDEIGQKLTALRMAIGRLDRMRSGSETDYQAQVAEAKELAETTLRSARDLAMGLRPSMLDDLGLGAALQWQAREFSRHAGVPASVEMEGNLEELPEAVRTCAYRAAQEALTNCA
ncbi:MAG: hypothetical protein HY900_09565, partial [Deltaproteobacteria bacterium]|nr:hypothetical protein [Deltaproteobacteria bacterium]